MDDKADRAVLNQIADMIVDLAAPAILPTPATSTATDSVDKGGGKKNLEAAADQVIPRSRENPLPTEASKTSLQRDPDGDDDADGGATSSDIEDSGSSDAGDSPEETGEKPPTEAHGQAAPNDDRCESSRNVSIYMEMLSSTDDMRGGWNCPKCFPPH